MKDKIYIAIAEDHDLMRGGLISMFDKYPEIEIAIEARNGKELLDKLKDFKPDVVLLDIEMPTVGGVFALEKIKKRYPDINVIIISVHSEATSIIEYIKRGANSFLTKNCNINILIEAIYSVNRNEMYFEKSIYSLLSKSGADIPGITKLKKERKQKFTDRDIEVLNYISEGKPFNEIANLMGITEGTVHWYRHKLQIKTNTEDMSALIAHAKEHEII